MTFEALKSYLESRGYRQYPWAGARALVQKKFQSAVECESNGQPAFTVLVYHNVVEIDVTGEQRAMWFKLQGYGVHWSHVPSSLPRMEAALAAAWEATGKSLGPMG